MKKLILVAAPPACGKNYVSQLLCNRLKSVAYMDKDDLSGLVRCCFTHSGEKLDMDGDFYLENLRSVEYETLMRMAFSALRFEEFVVVNAPFLKEVRNVQYMRGLKQRAATMGAELILIWVSAPAAVCYDRMKQRNSDRDSLKLLDWQEYVKKIDFNTPNELVEANGVDQLFVFDNTNAETGQESLRYILEKLGE